MKTIPSLFALSLLFFAADPVRAAVDIFLEIDGIDGETDITGEPGLLTTKVIQLQACDFGTSQPVTVASNAVGMGVGKSTFSALTISKLVDKASPLLFLDSALGKTIPHARLFFRKPAGETAAASASYFQLDFEMLNISSYSLSGDGASDAPSEIVKLRFGAVKFTYRPLQQNGSLGNPVIINWSDLKNSGGLGAGTIP